MDHQQQDDPHQAASPPPSSAPTNNAADDDNDIVLSFMPKHSIPSPTALTLRVPPAKEQQPRSSHHPMACAPSASPMLTKGKTMDDEQSSIAMLDWMNSSLTCLM